ncbi:hypothetical protein E2562_023000 [Oryza meyeriana var. granulata]|uniref:Uncharacterized protein n=1 Tax=Oryza meyeriana var. granulata TaxID=110450 RepID=A0A6G1EYJ2_9ORYZ|nr:hypothetical protein E2562_023000 [Oryza meyeriana var. granulata]
MPHQIYRSLRIPVDPLLVEKDFKQIAEYLHQVVTICLDVQKERGKLLKYFNEGLENNIENLRAGVEKFATSFEMPGF